MQEHVTETNPMQRPASSTNTTDGDSELAAINVIVAALTPLMEEQRFRALEYILRRFNAVALQATPLTTPSPPLQTIATSGSSTIPITDIRSFKEVKQPKSANEMATLVAFYLSELASPAERKQEIDKKDVERYFKLASFRLTSNAGQTLINAKNAGYLDGGSGAGQYKLNPVGYNLVAHRMGIDAAVPRRGPKNTRKKAVKKAARPKK
jgi:hypothetical protein